MKNLILSLFPVIVFWLFEEQFGSFWGIIAAIVWSIGEMTYEKVKLGKIQRLTLFSSLSCIIFGALGAWLDHSEIFRLQPALLEFVFIGVFIWMLRGPQPKILEMIPNQQLAQVTDENLRQLWIQNLKSLGFRMSIAMLVHAFVMIYFALKRTTGEWVFMKGPGFLLMMGLWFVIELIFFRKKSSSR